MSADRFTARLLVCGSREWTSIEEVRVQMAQLRPAVVIHGAARGAGSIAAAVALTLGATVEAYPADWRRDGRSAGPIRNAKMLREGEPTQGLAFGALWKPRGSGPEDAFGGIGAAREHVRTDTGDMVQRMLRVGVQVRWISAPGATPRDLEAMPGPALPELLR